MEIQVGERLAQVNLVSKDGDKMTIDVDGKIYVIDACMFANGQCSILNDGISYNPFIVHDEGSRHYAVSLNYSMYDIDIMDSQAKYMRIRKEAHDDDAGNVISSPMPSKIVKVYVAEGDEVRAGEPLIVYEAMKMQNTVLAKFDCTVQSVNCQEGDPVMAELPLIILKPKDTEDGRN